MTGKAEGRETLESWRSWWDEHEREVETLLKRGEFLHLKPCRHDFQWVPLLTSQKGAIAILDKNGTDFEAGRLYQERYLAELDAFCEERKRAQRARQRGVKSKHPALCDHYPKFSKALTKALELSDEIESAATEAELAAQESELDFPLPAQVWAFFLLSFPVHWLRQIVLYRTRGC